MLLAGLPTLVVCLAAYGPVVPAWDELEVVSPEEVGWSFERLQAFDEAAAKLGYTAVMLAYDGKVFHEWGNSTYNYRCHSIRKPFLGALYGIHVARGEIDLDATLKTLGIDDIPPRLTAEEKTATIRQLLQSRSGIYHEAAAETEGMSAARPARGSHAPGTFFYYNNWDFNALGTIFNHLTGLGVFEAFEKEIAIPLGMQDFAPANCEYQLEAEKSMHPAYSFRMSARDMLRFGILFQQGGTWRGQQIIPKDWIEESTQTYSIEDAASGVGYGYLWKTIPAGSPAAQALGASAYLHTGLGVHSLVIVPELKLVVVMRFDTDGAWEDPGAEGDALPFLLMSARL
ncbi:MAG: serine hydrolase [Thermotogota bacterium]